MSKKHRTEGGMVYSTNPDQPLDLPGQSPGYEQNLPPLKQDLRVALDKKQRGGKSVTVVSGYQGNPQDLEKMARMLKSRLGVGGAAKEGLVLIQGDFREKVLAILLEEGFRAKRSGG